MKVVFKRTFDDLALRTIRAAIGRGGRASRKECLTFIDRAISDALRAAPDPKPKRTPRPKGETFVVKPVETPEEVKAARDRIRKIYKH